MGILREDEKPKQNRIEDVPSITYADYIFDDSTDDEDIVVVTFEDSSDENEGHPPTNVHQLNYERRLSRRNAKFNAQKAIRQSNNRVGGDVNIKKNMGARNMRRVEHARILAQFADANDIRFDCSDLVEETVSAFTRLLRSEKNLRSWIEFTEKSEEEQVEILRDLERHLTDDCFESTIAAADEAEKNQAAGCSAKTSFMRLDKKFKTALSKKNGVRLELIEKLENEFRKFFNANPTGTWTDSISSTQKRFYLHAVAQFLMLQSRSQDNATNGTVTEVFNSRKKFEPPSESLHSFLNKKLNKGA
ncbi:R3H-assoc domain-containing protein [Aphelenchoides bicaudatus]|nr:R3H-assoc domain-containing protein [Aphelenchoides bicaudatus]